MLVDSCYDTYHNGYTLTQVHHRCGRVLRVRIRHDQLQRMRTAVQTTIATAWQAAQRQLATRQALERVAWHQPRFTATGALLTDQTTRRTR